MSAAFKPCVPCAYRYRRVYAWGGDFESSGGGLYLNDKASFISLYNSAIAQVNSIDISSVPWGQVRWFNYGGLTSYKADPSFVDSGNVVNNTTNLPGRGLCNAPCGTDDFGAITSGGSELSYMGLSNVGCGINAGGYQYSVWGITAISGPHAGSNAGWFAISRIQVDLSLAKCGSKWCLVEWDPNGSPTTGCTPPCYNITCDCDSTTYGSCPACENASTTKDALCVDIPTSLPSGFSAQRDSDLPNFARYFVPGMICTDLT